MNAREKLIDAGVRLLAEHGLAGVNSNQIAREAGVGVGTFYAHFPDKHALHQAAILQVLEDLSARIDRSLAEAPDDPEDQVRAMVRAALSFAQDQPERFRLAFARSAQPPARGSGPRSAQVGLSTRGVERRLRQLQAAGQVDPLLHAEAAARAWAAMQAGVLLWWIEEPTRVKPAELVETLVRLHPALCRP